MGNLISRSFKRETQSVFSVFALNIAERMSIEVIFEHLKNEVGIFRSTYNTFIIAQAAASNKGYDQIRERNNIHKNMLGQAEFLAQGVEKMPNVSVDLILLSGFVPASQKPKSMARTALAFLLPPENIKLTDIEGQPGVVGVSWSKAVGTVIYELKYLPEGEIVWQGDDFEPTLKTILSNLPSSKYVQVQIRSIGKNKTKSGWSAPKGIWVT